MGLAARQVDTDLAAAQSRYPRSLPRTHFCALQGWEPKLRLVGGMLAGRTPEEFELLPPLLKQLEINRAHAESLLALGRAGQLKLPDDERERLTQRAVGVLPSDEGARILEAASCPEFSSHFLTSNPERFVKGIAEVERELGQATALAYGFLLMAGVRSNEDIEKYGNRIEQLFAVAAESGPVQNQLQAMGKAGLATLPHAARARIVQAVRDRLWGLGSGVGGRGSGGRAGRSFLLTQVLDGYLGLRAGGVGDDLGLAVADGIVVAKLGFPVKFLLVKGGVYPEITVSARGVEYWDPFGKNVEVRVASALRLGTVDVLVLGYTRMARGYANAKSHAHGARVANWVIDMQPKSAEAYQILGQCLLGEQKPADAIDMCKKALTIDRRLADAYLVQGNAYSLMSRWPEAVEQYKQAIRCRVGYAEAYNNLGLALQRNGEPDRAVGAYWQAIRVRPDYAEAYYNMGNLHLERAQGMDAGGGQSAEYDLAIAAYRKAVEFAPDFAGAHYNLGQAHHAKQDLPAALAAYQAAVKVNAKHAGAWHNMGIVYRDMGQPDLAVEAIEKAVTLNPILLR